MTQVDVIACNVILRTKLGDEWRFIMATDSLRKTHLDIPKGLFEGNRLDQPTFHRLYEQAPEDFKAELIGGIVHVASPVGISHNNYHIKVTRWLDSYADSVPGVHALLDASVILSDGGEPQPDGGLRYEDGTSHVSDNYCIGPPELVVEVSHSTVAHDLLDKRADYEQHGVSEYLVLVIPESRAVWYFRGENDRYTELSPDDGILKSRVFPGLWLDAEALFRLDYKRVMAVLNEGLASVGTSS